MQERSHLMTPRPVATPSLVPRSRRPSRWELYLALNQPDHDRKQEACGQSTHQHTRDAFYRPQISPHSREK